MAKPTLLVLSLRRRLILLTLSALIPLYGVIAYSEYSLRRSREAEVRQLAARSADLAAFEIQRTLEGVQNILTTVIRSETARSLDAEACSQFLATLQQDLPALAGLLVVDPQGKYRCGYAGPNAKVSFADRDYIRDAVSQTKMVIGGYTIGKLNRRQILPLAMSYRDQNGVVQGVISAGLDLSQFGQVIAQRGRPEGGSITIADRDGVIVAREPYSDQFVGTRIPDAYQRLIHAPAAGTEDIVSQDGTRRILGYVPAPKDKTGLYVSVGLSYEQSYEPLQNSALISIGIALLGTVLSMLAAWFTATRVISRPVQIMTNSIARWHKGETNIRTGFTAESGELAGLGQALDKLMDDLEAHRHNRELLMQELAHRVKNTLANVIGIAAQSFARVPAAQGAVNEFNGRIVALSKAHEVLIRDKWESAELRALISGVTDPMCGGDETRLTIDGPPVWIEPRIALALSMIIHELCTNAVKYGAFSKGSGMVVVRWITTSSSNAQTIHLEWLESGGPAVTPPAKLGFGTRLITQGFGQEVQVELDFAPTGLTCQMQFSAQQVQPGGSAELTR